MIQKPEAENTFPKAIDNRIRPRWWRAGPIRRKGFLPWILWAELLLSLCGHQGCSKENQNPVLAEVNGQGITLADFQKEMASLPEEMRLVYERSPESVLDSLIAVKLLLQEAKRKGLVESADLQEWDDPQVKESIRGLFGKTGDRHARVTDQEIEHFYHQNRDQVGGMPLEEMREPIRRMILVQRQQAGMEALMARLRLNAAIKVYPERLPKPPPPALAASTAEEFKRALESGRPMVVDFGSSHCIPCIKLRPVLRAVKDAHGERIHVMFLELNDHRDLARQYRVQLIPTVIFFNEKGKEVKRHMGFMDRRAMEEALRQLGFVGG